MENYIMKGWSRMKRFTALLVSLLVILSCAAVFATDAIQGPPVFTEEERTEFLEATGIEIPEIVSCEFDCSMCHAGTFDESRSYTQWYKNGNLRQCPVDWTATDYEEERTVTHTYICNVCGFGYTDTSAETRWVCTH